MLQHLQLIISGRVQMVRFRVFVVKLANELGIIGTVENLPDGTVRVEVWGEKEQLQALRDKVKIGSRLSRVDNVAEVWDNKNYIDEKREFRIIH
ncbi:acylphosphatase [bacterium]|nr:acylphosphatase [Candidatus Elulimicrobium humile]